MLIDVSVCCWNFYFRKILTNSAAFGTDFQRNCQKQLPTDHLEFAQIDEFTDESSVDIRISKKNGARVFEKLGSFTHGSGGGLGCNYSSFCHDVKHIFFPADANSSACASYFNPKKILNVPRSLILKLFLRKALIYVLS